MMRRLISGALLASLAILPSACVVLDATSLGFAMITGQRVITVSGEAKWSQPHEDVLAVNLTTGAVIARGALDDGKRFNFRLSIPAGEHLAVALQAPGSSALLLAPRGEKRQEERAIDLTRGTSTVAWGLGAALAGIPIPAKGAWEGSPEKWRTLGERLPVGYGGVLQGTAEILDTVGVGSPQGTATELSKALKETLGTVKIAAGGHPRDRVLWPPVVLSWANALGSLAPGTGDAMAPQAAAAIDLLSTLDQVWAASPYAEDQGALEIKLPLREPETNRVPQALPTVIQGLRYQVRSAMLPTPREGTIARAGIRFQAGAVILRIPHLPTGFASVDLELLGENESSLGKVNVQEIVNLALARSVNAKPVAVSLENTPGHTPGAY